MMWVRHRVRRLRSQHNLTTTLNETRYDAIEGDWIIRSIIGKEANIFYPDITGIIFSLEMILCGSYAVNSSMQTGQVCQSNLIKARNFVIVRMSFMSSTSHERWQAFDC